MGRFYKPTMARPVDYMYRMNTPLMEKVLGSNEGMINRMQEAVSSPVQFNHTEQDSERANQIAGGYNNIMNDVANTLRADPKNWRNQKPVLTGLRQKLLADTTSGEISTIVGNYARRKATMDTIDEGVQLYNKTGGKDAQGNDVGISPERAAVWKAQFDSEFKGTNYNPSNPGKYNVYKGGSVMGDIDIQGQLSKGLKDLKDSGIIREDEQHQGLYLMKINNEWKGVSQSRVLDMIKANISPRLMNYMQKESSVGLMHGVYADKDILNPDGSVQYKQGDFIQPYNVVNRLETTDEKSDFDLRQGEINQLKKDPKKQEEANIKQKQLDKEREAINGKTVDGKTEGGRTDLEWDKNSYLATIMKGLLSNYAHEEVKHSVETKADPVALPLHLEGMRNRQQELNRRSTERIANNKATNDIMLKKMEFEHSDAKDVKDRVFKIQTNPNLNPQQKAEAMEFVLGQDTFIASPTQAFDPQDLDKKSKEYTALLNKQLKGQAFTPEEQQAFTQDDLLFAGVGEKLNLTKDQIKDLILFNGGDLFGSTYQTVSSPMGAPYKSLIPTHKYQTVKALKDKIVSTANKNNKNVTTLSQTLAQSTTANKVAFAPSPGTVDGGFTYRLIDKILGNSNINKAYYKFDDNLFEKDGKTLKKSTYAGDIDTGLGDNMSDSQAGANPLAYLVATKGGKPTDYLKNMTVKVSGNNLIISGTLDVKQGKGETFWRDDVDSGDVTGDAKRFQIVVPNMEGGIAQIYGNSEGFKKSASGRQFLMNTNAELAGVVNRVQYSLPYLTKPGQIQNIGGVLVEVAKDGNFKVSLDKGKTYYDTYGGQKIASGDQLIGLLIDHPL